MATHRELRGRKKAFTTVGVGVATLIWDHFAGLRPWDSTERFVLCVVAAYLTLTVLEFLGHLTRIAALEKWNALFVNMREDIVGRVAEIVYKETSPSKPKSRLTGEQTVALDAFLSQVKANPDALNVHVVSQMGDPAAYQAAQVLRQCFKKHDWHTDGGFVDFPDEHGFFVIVHDKRDLRLPASIVCEALTASDIRFRLSQRSDLTPYDCMVFVAKDY